MTNKIILSTITTLALLLNGCTDGGTDTGGGDTPPNGGNNNPPVVTENHAPVATQISFLQKKEGESVSINIASFFSDPDGDTLTFSANGLPEGLSISETGLITGTLGDFANGTYPVEVTADDGEGESTNSGADWLIRASFKPAGWYGKTEVSATASDGTVYAHSTAGVFGELVQSDDAKDQHDIPGYGPAILQVVFPQTDWDAEDNGDYFSNYQSYETESKKVWTFQIKNQHTVNLASAPISISLEGVFDVEYKKENEKVTYKESKDVNSTKRNTLNLVDVDNATSYTVDELATANLNMDGLHTRTFRWVLGSVDSSDYTALAKTTAAQSKSFSADEAADETTAFKTQTEDDPQTGGKFGLPPQ